MGQKMIASQLYQWNMQWQGLNNVNWMNINFETRCFAKIYEWNLRQADTD